MEKPKMKRVVAISYKANDEISCWISFYANATIGDLAAEFGTVQGTGRGKWMLHVDRRYDFDEVVAWLESFND
jgi:hypothetical protein